MRFPFISVALTMLFFIFVRSTMKDQKLDSSGRFSVERWIAPEAMSNGEA